MSIPDPPHKPDIEPIRERAELAKQLLENKAFQHSILELRKRWFQELLENGGGDLTGARLCARIVALEGLATELAILINDYKMALKNARGN
jgi:hypothetical protein